MAEIKKEPETTTLYVDGTNMILGRLASYLAKQALKGNKVILFNCEKMVITGDKQKTLGYYNERMQKIKGHRKGPFWPRRPDNLVRRTIKKMLPFKRERGKEAIARVEVYINVPSVAEGKKTTAFEKALLPPKTKFISIEELSKKIGSTGWY
ncbi:MAG: 50S ribosomal protein L13 [Candidatus Nanoarchaeia archaeon]|nr:50S ribosomal protein L13 [Candidatus Nanoarchaeia archaeon]MDD5239810.1 50S ribosomal protein L13 [Candidatus Nanoarchaeia archaeon]